MNPIDLPFDVSFYVDEQLREIPNDPDEMQRAIDFLQSQLDNSDGNAFVQARLSGLIGVYARLLRDFLLARSALSNAIAFGNELNDERCKVVNLTSRHSVTSSKP